MGKLWKIIWKKYGKTIGKYGKTMEHNMEKVWENYWKIWEDMFNKWKKHDLLVGNLTMKILTYWDYNGTYVEKYVKILKSDAPANMFVGLHPPFNREL